MQTVWALTYMDPTMIYPISSTIKGTDKVTTLQASSLPPFDVNRSTTTARPRFPTFAADDFRYFNAVKPTITLTLFVPPHPALSKKEDKALDRLGL